MEKKQIFELEDPLKTKIELLQPHYLRNTAAFLMKDTELERIVELDKKFNTKVGVLTEHYKKVKEDKARLHLDQFIIKQRKKLLEENARRLLERRKKDPKDGAGLEQKPKTIALKNLEGNKNKNTEDSTSKDANILIEKINEIAEQLLEQSEDNNEFKEIASYSKEYKANGEIFFEVLMKNPGELIERNGIVNEETFIQELMSFINLLFQEIGYKVVSSSKLGRRVERFCI